MASELAVGIDLGTTFSAVAYLDADGRPVTVRNAEGDLITPSVVFLDKAGIVVGKEAVNAASFEPQRVARFMKRDMGESVFSKTMRGEQLPPELLQAAVLRKLRQDAELQLGPIRKAVVTVPAFFNEPCRKATMDAGRLAGIEVLDIINEPTAAAICYGIQQGFLNREGASAEREVVLIYDLGGGTFDVTLMEIAGTKYRALATGGDVYLGGADWDQRLVDYLAEEFQKQCGSDPRQDPASAEALLQRAIETKHALSAREEMSVFVSQDSRRARISVTRAKFEELTADLLDRTLLTVRKVIRDAETALSRNDGAAGVTDLNVTRLLLVGGSTRMPAVTRMLQSEMELVPDRSLSPDEAVAHGAAVYAGLLLKQGAVRLKGISLTNVSSHDLGVLGVEKETGRPRRRVMIRANSPLPIAATKVFPLSRDGQTSVRIDVIEGGDDTGNNSTAIGRCTVQGLPTGLAAQTPVAVTFEYARNGRLTVNAKLPTIGRDANLVIERAAGLTDEDLDRWQRRLEEGLTDASVPVVAASKPAAPVAAAPKPAAPVAAASKPAAPVAAASKPAAPVAAAPKPAAPIAAAPKSAVPKAAAPITVAAPVVQPVSTPVAKPSIAPAIAAFVAPVAASPEMNWAEAIATPASAAPPAAAVSDNPFDFFDEAPAVETSEAPSEVPDTPVAEDSAAVVADDDDESLPFGMPTESAGEASEDDPDDLSAGFEKLFG
ncbi:MAG: Hsp70 family protein [Planctomycetaceae bacterium]